MSDHVAPFFRRNSVTIGFFIIAAALGTILFLQTMAVSKLQEQVEGQQQIIAQVKDIANQLNENSKERTAQINGIDRHLDCIVAFFAEPDRANRRISDIETCQTQNVNTGQQSVPKTSSPSTAPGTNTGSSQQTNNAANPQPPTGNPQGPPETPQPSFLEQLLDPVVRPVNDLIKGLVGVQ